MAETVISVIVQLLGSLPLEAIINEVNVLKSVQRRVENSTRNLRSIRAVLHDAENKRWSSGSESVKVWLETLEDDSQEMADVLDRWNTLILRSQIETGEVRERNSTTVSCFVHSSCFCFRKANQLISHREIVHQIEEIEIKATSAATQIGPLGLIVSTGVTRDLKFVGRLETTSFVDEIEIHGRDLDKKALLEMLMPDGPHGQGGPLEVISVVGMGGLGKTTLAQLAFNNEVVQNHFPKRIWVSVSEPFDLLSIASAIIENLLKDYELPIREGDESSQTECNVPPKFQTLQAAFDWISSRLGKGRFLLVLDDVWNEEHSKWEPLEIALKKLERVGSRVLVTTRKESVARVMGASTSHIIKLKELSQNECQLIFERRAFKDRENEEIEELRDLGFHIVSKCKGLPLAAKTLGALMHFKRTRQEWEDVLQSHLWELNVREVEQYLFGPLLLSYLDLSSLEKRCLLHCSIYPKDHLIDKRQLIEMWMSEGHLNSEEEGVSVFQNLTMRSFFQDFQEENNVYDDGNVVCKMHDILHDFVQYLTKRECEILEALNINLDDQRRRLRLGDQRIRHLTITMESEAQFPNMKLSSDNKKFLHTFLILRQGDISVSIDSSTFLSLRYLRSLNLSKCGLKRLPENIGDLIHLRYLEATNNPLEKLPNTICNLCNLQTLRLESGCPSLLELPEGIGKLVNLRSLYLWGCSYSFKGLPKGFSGLTSLRTLDWFQVPEDKTKCLTLRELTRKMNCSKLKINQLTLHLNRLVDKEDAAADNKVDLTAWEHINELIIYPRIEGHLLDDAMEFFEPHPKLKVLKIRDSISHVFSPRWIMSLLLLREIEFYGCHGLRTLPAAVGKLPSLESLHFWGLSVTRVGPELLGIMDEQVSSSVNCTLYPKLKHLKITSADIWEEWETEVSCSVSIMPCLQSLHFLYCQKLRVLPRFLRKVPLQFIYMHASYGLDGICRTRDENEWPKISHAQNILVHDVHVQMDGRYVYDEI
ncbi:putative disease resistance protein RGA3 isoform X1 [Humulus lupulus]|uniref:putative disease resistance protein RGA3 isoform X1 n=1 Tax=Humulus lupulus TaxID=3486 RepID=UPI002B405B8F|nr:putative disease resistance protein RGA3 isoform X1 [Humulus lupulus]